MKMLTRCSHGLFVCASAQITVNSMSAFFMLPDNLQLDELTNATLMKLEQFRDRTATGQLHICVQNSTNTLQSCSTSCILCLCLLLSVSVLHISILYLKQYAESVGLWCSCLIPCFLKLFTEAQIQNKVALISKT